MKECVETHNHFPRTKGNHTELPKRVLDVSSNSIPETVQLHCSRPRESAPYAALSYCWGSLPQPIMLKQNTFTSLANGLRISELPQTIVDAIRVTRTLGLKYLWVDALCIFQDSEADQAEEIRHMARIYQQANITIAAGNAKGVRDGFLYAPIDPMENGRWIEMPFQKLGRIYGLGGYTRQIRSREEPLNQRAWTLQEDLLSLRLLIFDSQLMRWQCTQHHYMDKWGESSMNRLPRSSYRFDDADRRSGWHSRWDDLQIWHNIVKLYTARQLRYGSDKLAAISAVAQQAAKFLPAQYRAGLWDAFLKDDLLWFVSSHSPPNDAYVPPRYRGPSWSWISVDNTIEYKTHPGVFEAEILKCETQLVSKESPFGEVMSGLLVIRGPLARAIPSNREAIWRSLPSFAKLPKIDHNIWKSAFSFDRKEDDNLERDWDNNFLLGVWENHGLILEKMDDGQFRRIGLYSWRRHRPQREPKWDAFPEAELTTVSII